uniref:Uncharacterized protein n=1 Tax=viral metagenome TaxID=1070528 RepID=A0A6C0BNT7_9ZZZZ
MYGQDYFSRQSNDSFIFSEKLILKKKVEFPNWIWSTKKKIVTQKNFWTLGFFFENQAVTFFQNVKISGFSEKTQNRWKRSLGAFDDFQEGFQLVHLDGLLQKRIHAGLLVA